MHKIRRLSTFIGQTFALWAMVFAIIGYSLPQPFVPLKGTIPYALGVIIDQYQEDERLVEIDATIMVERDSQKGIVIGKGGQTLRLIGQRAREELEGLLEKKVMLRNHVKTKENWRDNDAIIHSMGHGSGTEDA